MVNEINLLNFIKNNKKYNDKEVIYYYKICASRNFLITKNLLGFKVAIYNGKYYIPTKITENMLGKSLGSFSFSHNILIKKKKNKYLEKIKK